MTQLLGCTGAGRNQTALEEMLPIVTYGVSMKWGKYRVFGMGGHEYRDDQRNRETRFLKATIWTYRDGEGCGITISGYAPDAANRVAGRVLDISTEGQ
jgi:hypothetical protein